MAMKKYSADQAYGVGDSYSSLQMDANLYLPGVKVTQFVYSWRKHKRPILFQPIPHFDEQGRPVPSARLNQGEMEFGPWCMGFPMIRYMGSAEKISMVMFDPIAERCGEYDARQHPYTILTRKIMHAAKNNVVYRNFDCSNWKGLLTSTGDEGAVLPRYKTMYLMQGLGYHNGEEFVYDMNTQRPVGVRPKDQTLAIMSLSGSAVNSMRKQFHLWSSAHEGADPFQIDTSCFLAIFKQGQHSVIDVDHDALLADQALLRSRGPEDAQSAAGFGIVPGQDNSAFMQSANLNAGGGDDDDEYIGYDAVICQNAYVQMIDQARRPVVLPLRHFDMAKTFGQDIIRLFRPWYELIRIPEPEEAAVMIAKALADKPLVLEYGWGDTHFMTEEVKGILAARKTFATGAGDVDDNVPMQNFGQAGGSFVAPQGQGQVVQQPQQQYPPPQQHMPGVNIGGQQPQPQSQNLVAPGSVNPGGTTLPPTERVAEPVMSLEQLDQVIMRAEGQIAANQPSPIDGNIRGIYPGGQ